jgi:Tfp pilus assembly protein PilO
MSPKLFNTLLILVTVVLYYMVTSPLYTGVSSSLYSVDTGISTLKSSVAEYDVAISQVDGLIKDSRSLQKEYDGFSEETKKNIMIMVPQSVEEIRLLSEMTSIAAESGIALEGLSVKDKGSGKYSITFNVQTTYQKFKDFITRYERSMRLLSLDSVNFNAGTSDDDIIKFSVVLSTYYLK